MPHGFTWMAPHAETIAVWTAAGLPELTDEAEARIPSTARRAARRPVASTVLEGLLRFETAHPHDEPHYYLGFVATHDDSPRPRHR